MQLRKRIVTAVVCLTIAGLAWGQAPNAGLKYLQTIPIPNWATSGSSAANYDLFAFNPVSRIMYIGDRTNHSITAIDTRTNTLIGVLPLPGGPSTNGVLIVPDLQQLVATDGRVSVLVYDLRLPGNGPDIYAIPGITGGTDALDYDPLNHTVYVINGSSPYYMTGINLLSKAVTTQFKLPGAPELMRFNPVDGLIYQVITDGDSAGVVVYDPVANNIKAAYKTGCTGHGIDIDPVSNTALVGCGTNEPQVLLDLNTGSVLTRFPDVTGTDLLLFNPNTRRFYVGASSNQSQTTGCPADTTKSWPIIGVIDAQGPASSGKGRLVGVTCAGRNTKVGIDTIQNFIYAGTRQYPVDSSNPDNGNAGVAVFYDPGPNAQALTTRTSAQLAGIGASMAKGSVSMRLIGRSIRLDASFQSVTGATALVNVTTTVGNEIVGCSIDYTSGNAGCNGTLVGDPLVGGVAMLAIDGAPAAKGTIAVPSGS